MTSRKRFNIKKPVSLKAKTYTIGVITLDILMALALSMTFCGFISMILSQSRSSFERAKQRMILLDEYQNALPISSLVEPYHSFVDGLVTASAYPYGNERIQTMISVHSSTTDMYQSISSIGTLLDFVDVLRFSSVRNSNNANNRIDFDSSPLCAVDFDDSTVSGSFENMFEENHIKNRAKPPLIIQIPLPVNPSLPLTDLEVRNTIAYVSSDSNNSSDPDIMTIDFVSKDHPILKASIDTGPGISSFALVGRRIFAAAASSAFQLHIIRVDSPNSLSLETKYKLPLPFASSSSVMGTAIAYHSRYIYLGTDKWPGDEFNIIDVSNPISPIKVGGYEIGAKLTSILIVGNVAYVTNAGQNQLLVLDVSDPSAIRRVASLSPSGWQRQEGKSMTMFEDAFTFGRTSGGYDVKSDHELFSFASTSLPNLASYVSMNEPGGVYGIVLDRDHVYLATRHVGSELEIISRDLDTQGLRPYSLPVVPQELTCDLEHLFVLAANAPYMYEISF